MGPRGTLPRRVHSPLRPYAQQRQRVVARGRILAPELAFDIVDIFLSTSFEGGRHQARLDELHDIEVEESAAWAEAQEAPRP